MENETIFTDDTLIAVGRKKLNHMVVKLEAENLALRKKIEIYKSALENGANREGNKRPKKNKKRLEKLKLKVNKYEKEIIDDFFGGDYDIYNNFQDK